MDNDCFGESYRTLIHHHPLCLRLLLSEWERERLTHCYYLLFFPVQRQMDNWASNTHVQKPWILENYFQKHGEHFLLLKYTTSSHHGFSLWMSHHLPGPTLVLYSLKLWKTHSVWHAVWQAPAVFPCWASTWCRTSKSVCFPLRYVWNYVSWDLTNMNAIHGCSSVKKVMIYYKCIGKNYYVKINPFQRA